MKNISLKPLLALVAASTMLATAVVQGQTLKKTQTDPLGDIHHNIPEACHANRDTDILKTEFIVGASENQVVFHLAAPVNERVGYKEFYFWLDVDADTKKGYQPYTPHDVAWPDMYADYRIFFSLDGPKVMGQHVAVKSALQNCSKTDCSRDAGLVHLPQRIVTKVAGNQVRIAWDKNLIPELQSAKNVKIGYTTYYEFAYCNGEDDSPQWGHKAHRIDLTDKNDSLKSP